jgi:hypothetical protein
MSKKATLRLRIAPLQRVVAEAITDPAEQAALDKLRKREKRKQRGQKPRSAIDHFLDDVNAWKLELHDKLKRMTAAQRRVFWEGINDQARLEGARGRPSHKAARRPAKRPKKTA